MPELGGTSFTGVAFPLAFGDRYVAVEADRRSGAPLVTVYRWDRNLDRLVVELFQGRPLPGAPPITVSAAGPSGAVRLGMQTGAGGVVGYLSGGDDPRSIVLSRDRLEVRQGDAIVFEMAASSITGFDIGVLLGDDGSVAIGASRPPGFPSRRLFLGATLVMSDLAGLPPLIAQTDFQECILLGPAVVAAMGPKTVFKDSVFDVDGEDTHFVWELPAVAGVIVGAIALADCEVVNCTLRGIAIAVAPGARQAVLRQFRHE